MHIGPFGSKNSRMDIKLLEALVEQIRAHASKSDQDDSFPELEFTLIKRVGLMQMPLRENPFRFETCQNKALLDILKLIGSASLPVGRIYEGHVNALQLIGLYGTPAQKEKYFHEVFSGQQLFGVWNTQGNDGVKIVKTGAGKYVLEGSKTFCSGGSWVQRPLITAEFVSESLKGWQMCIIPTEQAGKLVADRSFWKPLGMRASASYKMDFSGVVIDESDLLGPLDAYYRQPYFSAGAARFAAVQMGGVHAVMEETHRFLRELKRTDDPFQKARMAEMAYLVETGDLWVNRAAFKCDHWESLGNNQEELVAYINMARSVINEICLRCLQLSERSVGARGLMRPYVLERLHRDLTMYLKQPAPDAVLTSIGDHVFRKEHVAKLWQ